MGVRPEQTLVSEGVNSPPPHTSLGPPGLPGGLGGRDDPLRLLAPLQDRLPGVAARGREGGEEGWRRPVRHVLDGPLGGTSLALPVSVHAALRVARRALGRHEAGLLCNFIRTNVSLSVLNTNTCQ